MLVKTALREILEFMEDETGDLSLEDYLELLQDLRDSVDKKITDTELELAGIEDE